MKRRCVVVIVVVGRSGWRLLLKIRRGQGSKYAACNALLSALGVARSGIGTQFSGFSSPKKSRRLELESNVLRADRLYLY